MNLFPFLPASVKEDVEKNYIKKDSFSYASCITA